MASNRDMGNQGEEWAVAHLQALGYRIVQRNWRYRYWEVDIIATHHDTLVFVEVKSRSRTDYGLPADFVDYKKQRNLLRLANAYLAYTRYEGEIRFDIVSVYLTTQKIEVIQDAFWSN